MSIEQLVARQTSQQTWGPIPTYSHMAILDALPEYFEKLPVAAYACDAQGRVLWFNARAAELWGRSPPPGPGEYTGAYKTHFGDHELRRDETPMAEAMRTGAAIRGFQARIERPDGSSISAVVYVDPVKDEDGAVVGAVGCLHEVTSLHAQAAELAKRREEQAALHDFTSRLQHAVSEDDVHELALEAIIRALDCQRASILQFDHAGKMRFVAQRGLSETYRRAVDGHSPWTPDSGKAQAICIGDVERADLPENLRQAIRAEGIKGLVFIPLKDRSGLVGKFMAYYDVVHVFDGAEMEVAEAIARQLLFALERIRTEDESARASRAAQQLAAIVESSDDAVISKDLDGIIQTWNRGAQGVFGYRAEEVIGKSVTILMPPDRINEEPGILARIRRGERIEHYETVRRCKDGSLIDISLTVSPIRDGNGRITGASKIARNITERKKAEMAVRESERRLQDLLSTIPAAIYTTDAEGRVTYFNDAAVRLPAARRRSAATSGASPGSFTGRTARRCGTTSARWRSR